MIIMASNILKLTAQIVMSHASMRKLTPKELVTVIKGLYAALALLEAEDAALEPKPGLIRPRQPRKVSRKASPEAKAVEDAEKLPVGDPDYLEFMESREG
jgi:hypothetical protein